MTKAMDSFLGYTRKSSPRPLLKSSLPVAPSFSVQECQMVERAEVRQLRLILIWSLSELRLISPLTPTSVLLYNGSTWTINPLLLQSECQL